MIAKVERYDPLSNKWTMMAPLRDGVSNAAVVSAKLKLFVFGGTTIHRDKASKVGAFRCLQLLFSKLNNKIPQKLTLLC